MARFSVLFLALFAFRAGADHQIKSVEGLVNNLDGVGISGVSVSISSDVSSTVTTTSEVDGSYHKSVTIDKTYSIYNSNCGQDCYYDSFGDYVCVPYGCYQYYDTYLSTCATKENHYGICESTHLPSISGSVAMVNFKLEHIVDSSLPEGACKVENSQFVSVGNGCKDVARNLIWSAISALKVSWTNAASVCPAGFRLPTSAELKGISRVSGLVTPFNFDTRQRFWSSQARGRRQAIAVNIFKRTTARAKRTQLNSVVCLKTP